MDPQLFYLRDHIYADFSICMSMIWDVWSFRDVIGNLHEEINNFSIIAGVVARQQEFDIIHAHDWLTYPAGCMPSMVSGKPLASMCMLLILTVLVAKSILLFIRLRRMVWIMPIVIMCVSELTRRTVINEYHQDPRKVFAVHNAVYPLSQELLDIPRPDHSKEKVVTFLGRITMQKGPEYFVEAAAMVLRRARHVRFVMAGSGDMMNAMIRLAAERGIADRFHFPGFMRGKQVYEVLKASDVYVMPSVSEPFGILHWRRCSVERLPLFLSSQAVAKF